MKNMATEINFRFIRISTFKVSVTALVITYFKELSSTSDVYRLTVTQIIPRFM
jgi:hypothetical protein